jgi:3-deoxy-manno-octulosonate cytidylyltransferase (CMP-KDO synthetase)
MIEHVYRRAEQARLVEAVLVATDDERIAQAVRAFGGHVVLTRTDHATGTDRLAEVAAQLAGEIIVNVQGDEPMIDPASIDAAIAPLAASPQVLIGTLRRRIDDEADLDNPSVVKVVVDGDGFALYFTRARVPFVRSGHPEPITWRHIGLYVYRREFLLRLSSLPQTPLERAEGLEQLRALEHGYRICTVETTGGVIGPLSVDTPEDLERVRRLIGAGAKA